MNGRLALLAAVDRNTTESEAFRLALQHAMAELGGLGGMVHLRGPMSALRLVSSVGLPPARTLPWEIVDQEDDTAPAEVVRRGHQLWVPPSPSDDEPGPRTGMAAVPVFGGGRTVGALTVWQGERGEPTERQWAFLREVASWVEERMSQAPPPVRPARGETLGSHLTRARRTLEVGSWDWNIRTGELDWDEAAMKVYGTDPADFVPSVESWMKVVHPDDLPAALAAAQQAIRDRGVFEAEYRVRRPEGGYGWTQARGRVVVDDRGEPVRMVGHGWDSNEARSASDALSRALRHMTDGFLALDDTARIAFVNLTAERTLGSSEEELVGRTLWELPILRRVPGLEERCREAIATATPAGFEIQLPDSGRWYHLRLVPVPGGTTCYFSDVTERRRHDAEREAAEQAAARRAARISELTTALAKATTSRDVVDAVARRVLPPFGASGLIVQAIEDNRGHNVGAVGYSREFLAEMDGDLVSESTPIAHAMRTGEPLFVSSAAEYADRYPNLADRPHAVGKQSWAFLPLTASGRPFGACVISFDQPRRLNGEERTLLTAIAALVAQALERARLYDAEHIRAQELQRGLLPRELPSPPACTAVARYLPAGQGMEVGGDWYDVIPLSAEQVAFVIGDVMGHGLSEAATMGRLRTAVHTLAHLELPPDEIMSHLNEIVGGLGADSYATCLYALYDSTTRGWTFARAGHPPPAVVHPDGTTYFPGVIPDPPLGAAVPPFDTVDLTLPEGSLLAFYTDGLVESVERDIDEGMERLSRLLRDSRNLDLHRVCDAVIAGLLPVEQQTADDAALLVARVRALSPEQMASWPLPEDPQAAGEARKHVREQLTLWGLDELAMTTELLVSELVGNVVRHAKGPVRLRLLRSASLVCEVSDGSLTTPRIRRALEMDESGRGLQLISALCQRWGTRYTATGKSIWTEQTLPGR
ncbi:SpoIIE family protein phosphatase [Streptomyces sp. NPDC048636]|uniref:SpoIIE family protein phosphatase n=1 Tax=Streptomyces sp. NPDC048636 TaxID=3155762 RepID=UPI00344020D6